MSVIDLSLKGEEGVLPEKEQPFSTQIINKLEAAMLSYAYFNAAFLALGFFEFTLLLIFFTFLTQGGLLAFSLAALFLTFFSYFILRLYFQSQKWEKFQLAVQSYIDHSKELTRYHENRPQNHITLASHCTALANALKEREAFHYPIPAILTTFEPFLKTFSRWWRWHDLYKIREILLMTAIEENIKLVKCEPISLKVHAALANAYINLSSLYQIPSYEKGETWKNWVFDSNFQKTLSKQFRKAVENAIEEFIIIRDFAPSDPWIHTQLAYSYRDLKMPLEEIAEYEEILLLMPEDFEIQCKLSILYFKQGWNAKGLQMYAKLKEAGYSNIDDVIKHYGITSVEL